MSLFIKVKSAGGNGKRQSWGSGVGTTAILMHRRPIRTETSQESKGQKVTLELDFSKETQIEKVGS